MQSRKHVAVAGFELGVSLGRGAFGEVWGAVRASDGAEVALKVLRSSAGEEARLRFRREARAAAAVESAHVPRVLEASVEGDGDAYIAYERLEGETLEARLDRDVDLPLDLTLAIADGVLDALAAAHGAGVVHRDVKPSNVFLEDEGENDVRARLLDFGVAKTADDDARVPLKTSAGKMLGSLAYMAPEQAGTAATADERADVYGIGAVVFRCLAGRPPFSAASPAALLALKLERGAPRLSDVTGVAWPKTVETWLGRCLAREAKGRFASAAAAREALFAVAERVGSPKGRGG